jgi:hypothetical protein
MSGSSIAGTLTTPSGARRDFHGWIELTTAIEALLGADDPQSLHPGDGREPSAQRSPPPTACPR